MNNSQRRIGVLLPPGNVAVEREFGAFAPASVACNYNRMSRPISKSTKSSLLSMIASLERASVDLAHVHPEVILFACTSGSFLEGRGKEDEIARRITRHTQIPAITTSMAVTDALDALGIRRAFMITPYPDDINEEEVEFLAHYGVEITAYDSFQCEITELTAAVPSEDVAAMALRHRAEIVKAGALFISCTQLLTMGEIEPLERALGVPVVTSNQATLWAALRFLKIHDPVAAGQLFAVARVDTHRRVPA